MDDRTVKALNEINRRFYEVTASEFHVTRGRAWPGWERLLGYCGAVKSVLDVGCGNGRFASFLAEQSSPNFTYVGLDNSIALLGYAQQAAISSGIDQHFFIEADVLALPLSEQRYPLVVLFGVLHHVPGAANRRTLVRQLAQRVQPGGMLAFASWRFYEYERFRARIVQWPSELNREAGDYMLDWRRGQHAQRYCHYVDDEEQTALCQASGLMEIERYRADGEFGDVNCYSILRA